MENKIHILYIDDEFYNLISFYAYFRRQDEFEVYICRTAAEGLEILKRERIHAIVVDQRLPGHTDVEFLELIDQSVPIRIVVTAHRNIDPIVQAFEKGAIFNYYQKPFDLDDIKSAIKEAYKIYFQKDRSENNQNVI